ncbi:MAG: flotillin family protein [Acidimicrobiia bacterium]|nr:flotillin family protein [Acidimicrobiia bacterium]
MEIALAAGALIVLAIILVLVLLKRLIIICPPNLIAVISGRRRAMSDGRHVGYRILNGGRTLRVPFIERVSWMSLNTIPIEVTVTNAYSKGAIPLNVQGIANVKVANVEGLLENSVERFLDVPFETIRQIAKETLEANLRGVLATLTPEEVNEDRLRFAQTLADEADDDIRTLGLGLDVLKIQNVTDEVGYLDSVGRRRTAEVLKEARIAEAERSAEALEAEADARQRAEIATVQADRQIVEQQNELRVRRAELEAVALAKEKQAAVAGEIAKATAEQDLQQQRIALQERTLEADVVAPARAAREAAQLEAQGKAAAITESGNATIEVFAKLVDEFQEAGPMAERVYVLRMLPDIVDKLVSTVDNVLIDRISIVDSGSGNGVSTAVSQLPGTVVRLNDQIEAATGVNLLSSLAGNGKDDTAPAVDEGAVATPAQAPAAADGPDAEGEHVT